MCSQIKASGEVEVCLEAAAEVLQSSVLLILSLNISFAKYHTFVLNIPFLSDKYCSSECIF